MVVVARRETVKRDDLTLLGRYVRERKDVTVIDGGLLRMQPERWRALVVVVKA